MDKRRALLNSEWETLSESERQMLYHMATMCAAVARPRNERLWFAVCLGAPIVLGKQRRVQLIGGHTWRRAGDDLSISEEMIVLGG